MAEGTGGGHDTAMQPPRLLLPPSPSYPHARTALSPSLFPSSPTPGGMGRHGGGEHVEGKGGGTQPSGSGRGHRSPSAALPPPPFTLPHHHTSRATRWGLPSPLPTALLTHPGPHSFPLPSPFHSQRGGTLQWGRTRGGYGKVQGGGSVSWECTGRWYECGTEQRAVKSARGWLVKIQRAGNQLIVVPRSVSITNYLTPHTTTFRFQVSFSLSVKVVRVLSFS